MSEEQTTETDAELEKNDDKKSVKKEKSKRPTDSDFKQQRLETFDPHISPKLILSSFFIVGLALIGAGILLRVWSSKIREIPLNYTNCPKHPLNDTNPTAKCSDEILAKKFAPNSCKCQVHFTLNKPINGQIFIYYKLTNFYHNHRAFIQSRSESQFLGDYGNILTDECKSFRNNSMTGCKIVPCGSIANALFNDTMRLMYDNGNEMIEVPMLRTGMAEKYDKGIRYTNRPGMREDLKPFSKPMTWQKGLMELDEEDEDNNGFQNEDFIIWMKNEALKNFRKLYRKINHDGGKMEFRDGLPSGNYVAEIDYNFPVVSFFGTKSFIITTTSALGGKNNKISYMYIVVGATSFLIGIYMLITFIRTEKNDKDK